MSLKLPIPNFMGPREFVLTLNLLNEEFKILDSKFELIGKPFAGYFIRADVSITFFLETILSRINKDHNKYYEILTLILKVKLQDAQRNIEIYEHLKSKYEFGIRLAENKIDASGDYFKNVMKNKILLLQKTGENPNELEKLLKEQKMEDELNNINIVEFYKKRPLDL